MKVKNLEEERDNVLKEFGNWLHPSVPIRLIKNTSRVIYSSLMISSPYGELFKRQGMKGRKRAKERTRGTKNRGMVGGTKRNMKQKKMIMSVKILGKNDKRDNK